MAQEKKKKEYAACPVAFYTENCDSVDHSRRMWHNLLCAGPQRKFDLCDLKFVPKVLPRFHRELPVPFS